MPEYRFYGGPLNGKLYEVSHGADGKPPRTVHATPAIPLEDLPDLTTRFEPFGPAPLPVVYHLCVERDTGYWIYCTGPE
jgi:hypothetical protein